MRIHLSLTPAHLLAGPAVAVLALCACGQPIDVSQEQPTWETDIEPLMREYCTRCHESGGVTYEGLRLDSYSGFLHEWDESVCTAISPDVATEWRDVIRCSEDLYSMPPGAMFRMSEAEQALLLRWVELGLPEAP